MNLKITKRAGILKRALRFKAKTADSEPDVYTFPSNSATMRQELADHLEAAGRQVRLYEETTKVGENEFLLLKLESSPRPRPTNTPYTREGKPNMPTIRKEALEAVEQFQLRANGVRVKKTALDIVAAYEKTALRDRRSDKSVPKIPAETGVKGENATMPPEWMRASYHEEIARLERAVSTPGVPKNQLAIARAQLQDIKKQYAEFERQHGGSLPPRGSQAVSLSQAVLDDREEQDQALVDRIKSSSAGDDLEKEYLEQIAASAKQASNITYSTDSNGTRWAIRPGINPVSIPNRITDDQLESYATDALTKQLNMTTAIKQENSKIAAELLERLTDEERHVLDITADLWNEYRKLSAVHPSEFQELEQLIHGIQYLVARRVAKRVDPEVWG